MKELKDVIARDETLIDTSLESLLCEFKKLFLEGRSPRDAVLLLLLNMLTVHLGGIVEERYISLHHLLTELT